jgi:hypothetical protein
MPKLWQGEFWSQTNLDLAVGGQCKNTATRAERIAITSYKIGSSNINNPYHIIAWIVYITHQ